MSVTGVWQRLVQSLSVISGRPVTVSSPLPPSTPSLLFHPPLPLYSFSLFVISSHPPSSSLLFAVYIRCYSSSAFLSRHSPPASCSPAVIRSRPLLRQPALGLRPVVGSSVSPFSSSSCLHILSLPHTSIHLHYILLAFSFSLTSISFSSLLTLDGFQPSLCFHSPSILPSLLWS